MARLDKKIAVITGGGGSIGIAAAALFVQEGAKVLLVDIDEDALKDGISSIGEEKASYVVADVTKPDEVEGYVQTAIDRYGGIDIFLNNAGIEGKVAPIIDYPVDEFDKVMAVNIKGMWLGMKYVMPHMQEKGGSVVITSSVAGMQGTPGVSAYTISKHAVVGLMRCAALEGAPNKIRVNSVHPAPIDNRMMDSLEEGMGISKEELSQQIPWKRYGRPIEVARMMLFLASNESDYVTGGMFTVDGGQTAS